MIFPSSPTWISRLPDAVSPLLMGSLLRSSCTVLFYHVIEDIVDTKAPKRKEQLHTVSLRNFYHHLTLLKKHTSVVSMQEIAEQVLKGRSIRGLSAITFDDGSFTFFTNALPVLKNLDLPVTFYVATSLLEGNHLWRDKIRYLVQNNLVREFIGFAKKDYPELAGVDARRFYSQSKNPELVNSRRLDQVLDKYFREKGIELSYFGFCSVDELKKCKYEKLAIGNHSHSHYMLSSLSSDEQEQDLALAQEKLREWGLEDDGLFCMPFGGPHTYTKVTLGILRDLGYFNIALNGYSHEFLRHRACAVYENQVFSGRCMGINARSPI